ncbi:MAG: Type 1 glutamine amidotransferase-like domain-containing protein [Alphaproteobacteria bacterium]|nr:Type 1 glutamine amidotransferase-like domain-containing protein [Alphaproteobacteria bacterium]
MTSDPMGSTPGKVLLNGNAETLDRFVQLAHRCLGDSTHRDPVTRERDQVLIITGAWGKTELNDAPVRKGFADTGRGHGGKNIINLELYTSVQRYLKARDVVRSLYEEHEHLWWELFNAYSAENAGTVERLREAWNRAAEKAEAPDMYQFLTLGERLPPGPRTRPMQQFLRAAYSGQLRRQVEGLVEADLRHEERLRDLWIHFHHAAGIEFDPYWNELRGELVRKILQSNVIVLPGGSPSMLLIGFRFFQLEGVLTEALRRGTSFFGTSAGAMVLGRRVVIFHDHREPREEFQLLENGVRLVEGLQIFPHCTDRVQTEDPANLAYLAARFNDRFCVGLNAGSVLELVPERGRWRAHSVGDEDVVVFDRTGEKLRYPPGAHVESLMGQSALS